MNQDKNYINENYSYSNEINTNLHIFNIFGVKIAVVVIEKLKDGVLDKTAYNLWKKFFDNLNKGEDLEIAIDIFVRGFFDYELPLLGERMMKMYENNTNVFLYHNDIERIRVIYKKALRDRNIDSILEE